MNFVGLVPNVFYADLADARKLFVDCLQLTVEHQDVKASQPYFVLEKDGIRLMVFQDAQLAQEHHPELRLVTDHIEEVYATVLASHPHLLPPPSLRSYAQALGCQGICDCRYATRHPISAMVNGAWSMRAVGKNTSHAIHQLWTIR